MGLRSLLFSSDGATADPISQVLSDLGVEGEYCSEAVVAVDKVTHTAFQIVIIDWDNQPEAGLLLTAARERKASERPLTLAIVSDDASVPKALQAGANSILRKPIMVSQVKDTLTTARDLLRARENAATAQAAAAAAGASAGGPSSTPDSVTSEKTLRAGEFLQAGASSPGGHYVTESELPGPEEPAAEPIDPLTELETVAAAAPPPPPLPTRDEPRGLEWYLKKSGVTRPAPANPEPPRAPDKPELLGFDQSPSQSAPAARQESAPPQESHQPETRQRETHEPETHEHKEREQKAEAKLFAYIAGEEEAPAEKSGPRFRLGKGAIIGALLIAACAVAAAPQAPWHPQMKVVWKRGQLALHAWLNPQPVTTAVAPESHENFGRAGDEYKLPVAENIPDATTDPSQIQVVPVVDPTAKKPNNGAVDPNLAPADGLGTTPPSQPVQPAGTPAQENPAPPVTQPAAESTEPASTGNGSGSAGNGSTGNASTGNGSTGAAVPAPVSASPAGTTPVTAPAATKPSPQFPASLSQPSSIETTGAPVNPALSQPQSSSAPSHVPSSLKSNIASMTPEASGNKPPEAAMASIEPVAVTELAERALLADQPAISYPANARGQQGTVVLQVLIGRDGTVQDAKFLQGSLAFARTAIDGVKLWKFKPYSLNGRPVSVQTNLTMAFKP